MHEFINCARAMVFLLDFLFLFSFPVLIICRERQQRAIKLLVFRWLRVLRVLYFLSACVSLSFYFFIILSAGGVFRANMWHRPLLSSVYLPLVIDRRTIEIKKYSYTYLRRNFGGRSGFSNHGEMANVELYFFNTCRKKPIVVCNGRTIFFICFFRSGRTKINLYS